MQSPETLYDLRNSFFICGTHTEMGQRSER